MPHKLTQHIGQMDLEAPAIEGFAFLGRSGWVGFRCSCGFIGSARSLQALEQALEAHQEPATCPTYKATTEAEAEA